MGGLVHTLLNVIYEHGVYVITSTWWEGLVLPMIPRAMPAGAYAPGKATQASKVKDEGRS
jgi:hypothetical protein